MIVGLQTRKCSLYLLNDDGFYPQRTRSAQQPITHVLNERAALVDLALRGEPAKPCTLVRAPGYVYLHLPVFILHVL